MKNPPCYRCEFRHPGCQTKECPHGYGEWKARLDAERKAAREAKDADAHTQHTIEINCKRANTRKRVGQR